AGRPAKTSFQVTADSRGASVGQFVFQGGDASAHGSLRFDSSGALQEAHLTQFRVSPGDDMRLDADQGKDALNIVVRGANLDARPFLRALSTDEGGKNDGLTKNVDLNLRAALVTGNNREAISNFVLRLAKRGDDLRQFQLAGRFGRAAVAGVMVRTPPGMASQINVTSANAGRLLAFTDLYRRVQGGALSVTMALEKKSIAGRLTIHNFVVRNEPGLRRIVSEGVAKRTPEPTFINTSAAQFTKLQVDFTRIASRIYLRDGSMFGPQIGTTLAGWLDFAHNKVNLSGTFVPAYGLNNLFSQIPIFGLILGGGAHEGLFGVNFRISGAASAPVLTIDPLSAIAPGFLRKIFGAIDNMGNDDLAPPPAASFH
ncbi:MAG TPA: AsmA-like C-terminal region-containing protein, partial [Beijerinckiaceae bacterium]|nr:AsmA-like C-terminal region-containing protein [Beijerinckiaceae bacterium]